MDKEITEIIELIILCTGFGFLIFYSVKWLYVFYKYGADNWNYEEFNSKHKGYRTLGILIIITGIFFSILT